MKKPYIAPQIELFRCDDADVLTTSTVSTIVTSATTVVESGSDNNVEGIF